MQARPFDRRISAEMTRMQEELRVAVLRLSHEDLVALHKSLNEIQYQANLRRYTKHGRKNG